MNIRVSRPMYVQLKTFAESEKKNLAELSRDIFQKFLEEKDREAYDQNLDFYVGEEDFEEEEW